jgi:hypothetical protein
MQKRKIVLISILSIIIISLVYISINIKKIRFEYYIWQLSSESVSDREEGAKAIVKMGEYSIPLLIKKLDNEYVFERYYIINCLEQITGIKNTHNSNYVEAKLFWKNWWENNKQKFN